MNDRKDRLKKFDLIPSLARHDHRNLIGEDGKHALLSKLSRNERRQLKKGGAEIAAKYQKILKLTYESGAGFPIDDVIRELCAEYINRMASSGVHNFPASFNYFEPFLSLHIMKGSTAPYFTIRDEADHLFELRDFLDFATSDATNLEDVSHLGNLVDSKIYHFTTNGDIFATTVLDAVGREFLISGFSMMRIDSRVHWYLLGGEVLSEEQWEAQASASLIEGIAKAPAWKRAFLTDMANRFGGESGRPVPLEGTTTAIRTIVAGEFNYLSRKHISRLYMAESEKSFAVFSDDPDITSALSENDKLQVRVTAVERLGEAGPLWNMAEALFQMPNYFSSRVSIGLNHLEGDTTRSIISKKGGRGVRRQYQYIKSIDNGNTAPVGSIVKISLPHFAIETSGHWRRISLDSWGKDEIGEPIKGRTWVKSDNSWRATESFSNVVYVKDTLSSARVSLSRIVSSSRTVDAENLVTANPDLDNQELYVMRCAIMSDEVFKVGWTDRSSTERAKEISAATGVPEAFVVVSFWKHRDARAIETEVHATLSPFRVSNNREFFKVGYPVIRRAIEAALLK